MRVQRVLMPGSGVESWTLLGKNHAPIEPVERFLAYLASIERSPNTVKAYAHDLKDWFTYLVRRGLDWRSVTLEDVAGYVAWLRLPPAARDGRVVVLPTVENHCTASSVNRKLAALTSFCEFHARHGVPLAGLLVTMQPAGRGRRAATSYKPFLHHVSKGEPQRRRTIKLALSSPRPQVLAVVEAQAILDACEHLRDRLLFALLLDTGMRPGEAYRLDREHFDARNATLTVVRSKYGKSRQLFLHSSTVTALQEYGRHRDRFYPQPAEPSLLVSMQRTRLNVISTERSFVRLAHGVGLKPRSDRTRPRLKDLRHYVDGRVMRPAGLLCLVRALPAGVPSA